MLQIEFSIFCLSSEWLFLHVAFASCSSSRKKFYKKNVPKNFEKCLEKQHLSRVYFY